MNIATDSARLSEVSNMEFCSSETITETADGKEANGCVEENAEALDAAAA